MKITYFGEKQSIGGCIVYLRVTDDNGIITYDGVLKHVERHSPDGFQWGYGGSGPAQLAYAILRRYFELEQEKEPRRLARELYQDFKRDIIAPNKGANLWITSHYITHWVSLKRGNNGRKTEVSTQF